MKIFGWAADQGGCGYYRMGLPLTELGKRGHDTQVSIMLTGHEKTADVVVGQRICNDGPSRRWQEWAALPTPGRPALVYELDDDLFHIDPRNAPPYAYYNDNKRLANMKANIAVADVVTVSTEPLAEVVREWNDRVQVIPNAIDERLLGMTPKWEPRRNLTIGWSGGFNHGGDWDTLAPKLRRFGERNEYVDFHFIGYDYSAPRTPRVRFTPWKDSVWDYYLTLDFQVGVIPLGISVFNRSKSHIKALEYAALRIPTIATEMEPYVGFISHPKTGYLVSHDHEWETYLRRLVADPVERFQIAEMAHRRAEAYTIQKQAAVWERVYENAVQ